jgi:hypothetical protein
MTDEHRQPEVGDLTVTVTDGKVTRRIVTNKWTAHFDSTNPLLSELTFYEGVLDPDDEEDPS